MEALSRMSDEIRSLELLENKGYLPEIQRLKVLRKTHSNALQDQIFEQYYFLNKYGESKSLMKVFEHTVVRK